MATYQFYQKSLKTGEIIVISQPDFDERGGDLQKQFDDEMNKIGPKNPLPDPESWTWMICSDDSPDFDFFRLNARKAG